MKKIHLSLLVLLISSLVGYAQTTFNYTGSVQTYTVPASVTSLSVDMRGACGGFAYIASGTNPVTLGGRVVCSLAVTPGTTLNIYVGQAGPNWTSGGTVGGYNGGGYGGSFAASGGGATDIRMGGTSLSNRVVVAGGGGGGGDFSVVGGVGGGLSGGAGGGGGACGGGQTAPACTTGNALGTLGQGAPSSGVVYSVGGGGGGLWGGNQGVVNNGGGGGGSSFANTSLCSSITHTQGFSGANGNGMVILTAPCTTPPTSTGTLTVCSGSTTTLSNSVSGGIWSSSNTSVATVGSATGVVTGSAAGTANITYTTGSGCFSFVTVTVNPLPTPILGIAGACVGGSTTLVDTTGGGSWSSSNTSIATIGSTGILTGVATGSATISYTLATGCKRTITVFIGNPVITGGTTLCISGTTTLTGSPAGGSWTSSTTSVATVSGSGVVTGVAAGTTTITYTIGESCFATKVMTVTGVCYCTPTYATSCAGLAMPASIANLTGVLSTSITDPSTTCGTTGPNNYTDRTATMSVSLYQGSSYTANIGGNSYAGNYSVQLWIDYNDNGTFDTSEKIGGGLTSSTATSGANAMTLTIPAGANPGSHRMRIVGNYSSCCGGFTYPNIPPCITSSTTYGETRDYMANIVVPCTTPTVTGTSTVCVGSTITLTSSGTGGSWISSATGIATVGSTGIVTGVSAGTATISYVIAGGCVGTKVVSVNPLPNAGTISGGSTVCEGFSSTTLTSTVGGGVWTSSNTAIATVGSTSGIVNGVAPGTVTISYTVTNSCGSATVTRVMTVNPAPVITGTLTVCVSATTSLTSSLTGGSWFSSNTSVATVNSSGVVSGVSAGTASISYYNGCLGSVVVSVNPLPSAGTLSGASTVCEGATTTFSSTVGGGSWSSSNTSVATVDASGIVSGISAGSAMISYTVTNGCGSATATMPITVLPLPSAGTLSGSSTVCEGATTSLSSTVSGGSWISSNTSIATINSDGVVSGIAAGAVTISYIVTNSCGTAMATMAMTVLPLPSAGTISGASFVCAGATTTYTSTVGGGVWTSSNTSVATVGSSTGIVTGVSGGSATISYTVTNSCGSATATASITVGTGPSAGAITGSGTVCLEGTTTLGSTVAGGTWSSSNTSIATISEGGTVSGVAIGTCTISYTVTNSCGSASATLVMTVHTVPSAGGLAGATSVCVGASTSLTASVSGGTWTSADPSIASVTSTGLVTGVTAGSTTITYTVTNECGSSFVTRSMVVNPLPDAGTISGTAVTCANAGATLSLSNTVSGGAWSSSNTSVATINASSGLVSAVSGGTSTISYTVTNACGSSVATYEITINPLPSAISGASSICFGASTTFSSSPAGGTWSSSNTSVATVGTDGTVTGVSAGAATITYMLGTGCYRTKSITINSLPSAISGSLSVCEGSSTTLSGSTGGVSWSSSNTSVATIGSTSGVVTGISAGTTDITYTVTTGCQAYAVVTVNPAAGAISGASAICVGASSMLSTSSTCGAWSSSNTAVATVGTDGTVSGVAAGVATITFTTCDGCVTTYAITVNPVPAAITGTTSLCVGSSATLSSATSGGMWSSSNPSIADVISVTGLVAGLNVGTSTIAYTTGAGCFVSVVVSVSAAPAAISGPSDMCIGLGFTLTNSTSGGTWSSSNTGIATVTAGGVVTGMATGMATITYTLSAGCYVTKDITVNALPGVITGSNSVCVTLTTTLNSTTSGGTWISSDPSIATIGSSSGVVTGVTVGTITMTYMMSTGCYRTMAFTVNPMPSPITGSSVICVGSSTTLSNSTGGGVSWSSTNTAVATIGSTSGVVFGVSPGTTIITYLVSTGGYATLTMTVVAMPSAITGTATVCTGQTTTLSSSGGGSWSSSFPAAATVNSSTGVVTGVAAGTSVITYAIGACYVTQTVSVSAAATAITGTTSMCTGSSSTLSSTPFGGTWSSSNTGVATIGTSGIVTGVTAGTSVISYVVGTAGCAAATTVTISAGPGAITGTLAVCAGSMVALSNGTPGGTWSSGTTGVATIGSATGILTGMSAGTSNISYTVGACRATAIVSVSAAPPAITGTTNVCVGASVTFTHPTSGGTWTTSNSGQATVGLGTGIVTGVGAGTPTITYFVTPGCYKTKNITVNGGSLAITGNTNVCQGSTSVLVCTTPGGLTWTSSNPAVATIGSTSGNVTAITVGTTEITYTATSGCTSFTTVSVLSLPTAISGTLTLCQGTTTALASVGTGGGTWTSSVLSKATVGSSTGVVSGIAGGTSNITYAWTNGCIRSAQVTVNPLPVAGAITGAGTMSLTSTPTQTLGASSPGGTWASSTPAVATIGAGTGFMQAVSVGTVRITYTVTNGCGTAFVTRLFSVVAGRPGAPIVSTGSDVAFSVYPNPTTGVITIETPVTGVFNVYSIDGRVVSSTTITDAKTTITLPNTLASGTYMCRFNGDDGSVTAVRLVLDPK